MKRAALLSTALIIIPTITQAQCVATTDCASLGYTQTSCPNGGLKCPFANYWSCKENTPTPSEPEEPKATLGTCTGYAANCKIADILNSDGTCTSNVISNKTPIGVVVYISFGSDKCGYAMTASPIQPYTSWSTLNSITGAFTTNHWSSAITDFNVNDNMRKIIQSGDADTYPAAYAALNYAPTAVPTTKGKWALPTAGILNSLYTNLTAVNNTISRLGGTQITGDNEHIWSSTQSSYNLAWALCTNTVGYTGGVCDFNKLGGASFDSGTGITTTFPVYPILVF